jgi:hypothetical protein
MKKTGLPFPVWILPRGNARHDVWVGAAFGSKAGKSELVSVAIRPNFRIVKGTMGGSELACLRQWVDVNRDVIVKYWEGEIWHYEEAAASIKPVRRKGVRNKLDWSPSAREPIFEFCGLESSHTNLPFFVWVRPSMGAGHDVRVGVSRDWNVRRADLVLVAIQPDVQVVKGEMNHSDLALLRRWVDLNRGMIVKYWNSEEIVYSKHVFEAVKRLPGKDRTQECVAQEDDDDALYEFDDLRPELTGLPFYVFVQPSMGARHGVRIGVSYDGRNIGRRDLVSVAIRPDVRLVKGKLNRSDLALLRQWVGLNRDMIVKFWKSLETEDYVDVFKVVKRLPLEGKR